jgi:hypothetical protein
MGQWKMCTKSELESLKGKYHSGDTIIYGMILKWTLRKEGGMVWTGFMWFRIWATDGFLLA